MNKQTGYTLIEVIVGIVLLCVVSFGAYLAWLLVRVMLKFLAS
jgi:prepilin-type N-terminal cleavage/methylation domain-containing protein